MVSVEYSCNSRLVSSNGFANVGKGQPLPGFCFEQGVGLRRKLVNEWDL